MNTSTGVRHAAGTVGFAVRSVPDHAHELMERWLAGHARRGEDTAPYLCELCAFVVETAREKWLAALVPRG